MLSLNQLRTLLAVARAGSVRGAADELVISQPAVSSALAGLTKAVGAPVVERQGRGIRLSPAGERLSAYARRIFALLDETLSESRAAAAPGTGRARLSTVTTAAEHLLPMLLRGFREAAGAVDVVVEVANKTRVFERLVNWEADLVLAGRPPQDGGFKTEAVRANAVVVIGARAGAYTLRDLAQATWLLREEGSGTRETTREVLAQLGIDPAAVTIGSNGAIRECVRAGLGISVLSRDAVARELDEGSLVEIATPATPLVRDWHLVTGTERPLPDGARRFVDFAVASGAFHVP